MTWIRTVPFAEADEKLRRVLEGVRALYPPEYAGPIEPVTDDDDGIVASHTLIPEALHHAFGTFGVLMSTELPLSRRQHEMIAAAVSAENRCRFCSISHAYFLHTVTLDEELAEALRTNYTTAPISEEERVVLDYAVKVTRDATRVGPDDHDRLRSVGFDDVGILQITLIAAWFNYINRVADALGVGRG